MKTEKKPTRAALPLEALVRVCIIDQQIALGKFPNTDDLVDSIKRAANERAECKSASKATISRDIAFMRDRLYAPIEYDALRNGYYYTEKTFRLPGVFASAEDLLALSMAKNILSLYQDTPVYDAAQQLLKSIITPISPEGKSDWFESRIIIPQVPTSPVPAEAWSLITTALRENHVLTFDYQGAYDEGYKPRRVRPYQLLFDTGIWYLYGFAEERKDIRLFSLCRIKNIVQEKEHFALPKDFDYRAGNADSFFGVFAGQKKQKFKIAFYDYSVVWVKDRQWARDQKIAETDDGVIVSFTSTQFDKVVEWVLSRGCTARPLEPETLVNVWRSNINEMRKMAGKQ